MTVNKKENPILTEEVVPDSPLKEYLINYVGEKFNPDDGSVTVEMIVETMAAEFPDFLMAIAEENFLRGYSTGLEDAYEAFKKDKIQIFENTKIDTEYDGSD